jgi:hypothetical protein
MQQGNEAALVGQVRQQFRMNMHESDEAKVRVLLRWGDTNDLQAVRREHALAISLLLLTATAAAAAADTGAQGSVSRLAGAQHSKAWHSTAC